MPKTVEAAEASIPQPQSLVLPSLGPIERPDSEDVQVVASVTKDYAADLAFMEEIVEVYVHPTADKFAPNLIQLGVQGVPQLLMRGRWQKVKRKYIAVLCDARTEEIETTEFLNDDGARDVRVIRTAALKYAFATRNDTPRGNAWLEQMLQSVR